MDTNKGRIMRVHSRLFVVGSTDFEKPRMDTDEHELKRISFVCVRVYSWFAKLKSIR
jgi:hypothetical protein